MLDFCNFSKFAHQLTTLLDDEKVLFCKFIFHFRFLKIFLVFFIFRLSDIFTKFESVFENVFIQILYRQTNLLNDALECLNIPNSGFITDYLVQQKERENIQKFVQNNSHIKSYNPKKKYRDYHGYKGPWVEDYWCIEFSKLPIKDFGVFVLIFIPWYYTFKAFHSRRKYVNFLRQLIKLFKPYLLYFTISSNNYGAEGFQQKIFPSNFLQANQGGTWNMVLPMHLKDLPPDLNRNYADIQYDTIFIGRVWTNFQRRFILNYFDAHPNDLKFCFDKSVNWSQMYA